MAVTESGGQMSNIRPQKVLVTGASGFIGSAVVRHLAQAGVDVVATARTPSTTLEAELGMPVVLLDVMQELLPFDGVQTLVHCATPNDIQSRATDGGLPLGVVGTHRLLEHAVSQGVRNIIYLSTLQVYGTELTGDIDETTPVACESMYGLNHYLGEEVCRFYAQQYGLNIVALRPSNVYGVPCVSTVNRDTLVPMCFVREARETGRVQLRSSGKQLRNFVSTDEVAGVISNLLDNFPKGFTHINATSDWHVCIAEIAAMTGRAWQAVKNVPLDIQLLSDKPETPEAFTVSSRYVSPLMTKQASRQKMADVIKELIEIKNL
jgi:nucleoside-diphosphate-sugar epimerase